MVVHLPYILVYAVLTIYSTVCNRALRFLHVHRHYVKLNQFFGTGLLVTILIIEILGRKKTMAFEFAVTMVGFALLFICTKE